MSKENFDCPTCEDSFPTEHGLKCHHARLHGESIRSAKEEYECANCGTVFAEYPSYDAKYCSSECSAEAKVGERTGADHPNWVDYETYECERCGEEFDGKPSNPNRFCSQECLYDWQSENFGGDDWHLTGARGEEHPRFEDHRTYRGVNWEEQREKALERDNHECVECGVGDEEHRQEHGMGLDVHHRVPIDEFDPPSSGNELDNLVSMCRSCHRTVEYNGLSASK